MTEYIYPAIFHHNDDNSYTITFPDLPGCISEGKNLTDALHMAESALSQWLSYLNDSQLAIPPASDIWDISAFDDEFANLIRARIKDGHAVRRTVSIPKWMDDAVTDAGLSLSRILQDALKTRLGTSS